MKKVFRKTIVKGATITFYKSYCDANDKSKSQNLSEKAHHITID